MGVQIPPASLRRVNADLKVEAANGISHGRPSGTSASGPETVAMNGVCFFPSDNVLRLRCSLCCTSAGAIGTFIKDVLHTIGSPSEWRSPQGKPSSG
jgi:hypothetical protein